MQAAGERDQADAASGPPTARPSRSTTTWTRTATCCSRCSAPPTSSSPQRVPDRTRKSGYRWKLDDTRRVLYRLPKIIEAVKDGEFIWVVEGEKDVHSLERAGVVATCNPGGTGGGWRDEYSEVLRDAIVVIVADKDKGGQAHARKVMASLKGIAAAVEIREAAGDLKDVSDHLAAGHSLAELEVTMPGGPTTSPTSRRTCTSSSPSWTRRATG